MTHRQAFSLRFVLAAALTACVFPAFANGQGLGGTAIPNVNPGDGNVSIPGGQTGGNQTAGTQTGGNVGGALSATDAFSGIQRGDTVGSTARTGAGFSDVGAQGAAGLGGGGLGGLGVSGFGSLGGGGFGGLGGGGFGGLAGGQSQNSTPVIRTRLRSAVDVRYPSQTQIQQQANRQLRSLPYRSGINGVNVVVDGNTAVISGVVASQKQRRMSELLMRLEPGIRQIDNQVTVTPQ